MNQKIYNENEQALKEFLLDISCLDQLAEWSDSFNLFDVLKITRVEIRHSNMLAWLLDPNENHGLEKNVLEEFIRFAIVSGGCELSVFDLLKITYEDFCVYREWNHLDILAVSKQSKIVLCIENKIDSGEGYRQLERYRKWIYNAYPEYQKVLIYLSPDGREGNDALYWCSMSYQNVLEIIEKCYEKSNLSPEVSVLISNYLDVIRRDIVGDEKLAKICEEIYAKHKKALDLIFEYKPDRAMNVAHIFHKWLREMTDKGELIADLETSTKTFIRFKTKTMSEILPDAENALSGWNTKNFYFYEIVNRGGYDYKMQFSVSSKNIPDDLRKICDRINEIFPAKMKKENWQWRNHFHTSKRKIDESIDEEELMKNLDADWLKIKEFEKKLKKELGLKE